MDNTITLHWLLSATVLLCLHQCSTVMGNPGGRVCPQGQLLHQVPDRNGWLRAHCCYPTRCGVGHQVKPCSVNGTEDTCEQCTAGRNQSLRTSSYTMERCTYWNLDEDCTMGGSLQEALRVEPNNTKRCMCDIETGLIYDPPENILNAPQDAFCQRMSPCGPGKEPTVDRKCRDCKDGYFKSDRSHKLCEPKTNCTMLGLKFTNNSTSTRTNHNCSEPEPITTPKPIVTEKPTTQQEIKPPPSVVPSTHSTTPSTTLSGDSIRSGSSMGTDGAGSSDSDSGNLMPLFMVLPVVVFIIITVTVILICKKKRNLQICRCDTNEPCTDTEKYMGPTCTIALSEEHTNHHRHDKPGLTQNGMIPHHLNTSNGNKPTNNNINGGHTITSGLPPAHPPGHTNGDVRSRYPSDSEAHAVYPNNRGGYFHATGNGIVAPPTTRAGILRNGQGIRGDHMAYAHNGARGGPENSLDSIAHEKKLMVDMEGMEANPDLGESDPLLVTESPRGVHFQDSHFQNMAASPSNSPPVIPSAGINMNPIRFIHSGAVVSSTGAGPYVASGALGASAMAPSPAHPSPPTTQVTFGPSGAVTFTRSTSVIASPEGEVEEEEMEALVPRFSQLLPDGEESNSAASSMQEQPPTNPIVRLMQERDVVPGRSDSPMRETTQQVRNPSERIHLYNPYPPGHQYRTPGSPANAQIQQQSQVTQHNRGVRPAQPDPRRAPAAAQDEVPDHCIMELKEQQLAESLPSSPTSPMQTQPKTLQALTPDPPEPDLFKGRAFHQSEQTELKTQALTDGSGSFDKDTLRLSDNSGASAETELMKGHATDPRKMENNVAESNVDATFVKQGPQVGKKGVESANNSTERKRTASGNSQGSRSSAGTGTGSAHNTLERQQRHRVASGDQQPRAPCLRSGSTEEGVPANWKQNYGRTVSFEDEGSDTNSGRPRGHHTNSDPRQHSPSHSGVANVNSSSSTSSSHERLDGHGRGLMRGLSDSDGEPRISGDDTKSEDESEGVHGSSKSSVTSEGSDSNASSPSKSKSYRRSQSENAPSSSDSQHKPPPRSMSEEKPQKQDRPIAKVKPMPASDTQLPVEVSDDTNLARPPTQTGGSNYNNLLDYSSEDSDAEEDARRAQFEEATAALQEDDEESDEERERREGGIEDETIDRH